jgi:signal recognition particle receptor subunit beta
MPHVDKRTGDLVIRIVYDGAPEAGKTTNVRVLHETLLLQRRGALASPGSTGRRTEFFDWRDFEGGYLEGRRMRCQLVSVPGQPSLLRRRRYLLETADVVVLVADAHPDALDDTKRSCASLVAMLARLDPATPTRIVLQANKQDLAGALTPNVLAALLDLPEDTACVAACAERGEGVRETFLTAVRLAAERVRALMLEGALEERDDDAGTPDALLSALLDAESESDTTPTAASERPPPPSAKHVPSGCVWPNTERARLLASLAVPFTRSDAPRAWAPRDAYEWRHGEGDDALVLHTLAAWHTHDLDEARRTLLGVVRQQLALGDAVPRERAIFLARGDVHPGEESWWIWMLTRDVPTLGRAIEALDDPPDAEALDALGRSLASAWPSVARLEEPVDPGWICWTRGELAYLPMPKLPAFAPTAIPASLRERLGDAWPSR